MVKAELYYNPYLLETIVKFNGHMPKINSLVEKHLTGALQAWVDKIPGIFYDEMNGYGFDLEFSGTTADFTALQGVFDAKGVSREAVRLLHKNELEDTVRKSEEISALLAWLERNPNARFDCTAFRENYTEVFDTGYEFVIIQGEPQESPFPGVVIEAVSGAEELAQTDLKNTAILFCVNEENRAAFKHSLRVLLARKSIKAQQLFFLIDQLPDRFRVERFIMDCGIKKPQLVASLADEAIRQYLARYPMTEYVRQAITVLRQQEAALRGVLQAENHRSIQANGDLYQKIDAFDRCLHLLKAACEEIEQRDNYHCPDGLGAAKKECLERMEHWRRKKVKLTEQAEALRAAEAYTAEVEAAFAAFLARAREIFCAEAERIGAALVKSYALAAFEDGFTTAEACEIDLSAFAVPQLAADLLALFTETFEQPKNPGDFFGGLLKNLPAAQSKQKEPLRVVTYLYSDWRAYAAEQLGPVLEDVIALVFKALSDFYARAAADYLNHLEALVREQTEARSKTAAQLSSDEQKLHEDNVWFASFQEKLREIERA